ncbi:MAG: 3-deoxy-D-manno-octulosonate 8-phosphate phosphatase [Lachnospiraceae bacterium]|jgi:3-deoxy-D-manno-octulosonate 8-phosphate phosphatase (KDO 8-P phosphatase)|nr:3-deoxy-D-manno-octulosonate 8-phosphate phosphatase [Lachnospiraceae bacterium]
MDGCGIRDLAIPAVIMPIIITGRKSNILEKRCKELGITKIYQGVVNKMEQMKSVIPDLSEMAYIGDDINDLTCMSAVKAGGGVVGCPADAAKEVVDLATFVSVQKGGNGAVREFIEWLLNSTPSFLR